jgi:hypothetical protein
MTERRIAQRIVQGILGGLGIAAIGIGTLVFLTGVQFIHFAESTFNRVTGGSRAHDPVAISPSMDNEFRFYAIFWIAYGVVVVRVATQLQSQMRRVPILMGLFFLGGVGRLLSYLCVGPPHPIFVMLMGIELITPLLVTLLALRSTAR